MATQTRAQRQAAAKRGAATRRTSGRRPDVTAGRFDPIVRQAERIGLIQLGAAVSLRDAVLRAARKYSTVDRTRRELRRLERRGETAWRRGQAVRRIKSIA